jgi:mannose-6-phosphate isomerase-like protein (cupin superfamily)
MKFAITLAALLAAAMMLTGAGESPRVTYVDHAKVADALAKGGALITQSDLSVRGSHRDVPGEVEVHDNETDVIYVVDGEATFVTGGKMTGGRDNGPGQHLGSGVQGGETHHLTKGDVITVPAGVPHWFKAVPHPISYYVVKVLKP